MRRSDRRPRRWAAASLAVLVMGSTVASVPVALAAVPPTDRADSAATIVPGPVAKRRGTIDVSDLSGSAVTSSPRPQLPYLEIPSRALPGGSPSTANGVTPTTIDSAPVAATGKITPSASNPGWAGFSFADTGFQPPDPWVAAGPDHVVQTVNTSIQMFDRQGNVERAATEISVGDFFNLPPDFGNSDPRVIYDSLHGRWIGTEVSWTCDGNRDTVTDDPIGYLDFIVSRTADPTGLWDLYYFGFLDELPDYPAAGTSTDKLAFTANHFTLQPTATCTSGSMYLGTSVIVTDWVDALAAGGSNGLIDSTLISFEDAGDFTAYFTARASLQVPATSSTLQVVVGHFNGVTLSPYYATVTGTVAAGNMAIPLDMDLTAAAIVGASTVPPPPLQPGTPAIVTTAIDFRPTDAIWQASRLSWVSTNGCTPTGDSVVRSCVRVTQVNTGLAPASPPTLAQDFLIAENGKHNFYGGIGQSGNGTLHVVWTRSSDTAGDQPSSMTAYHLLGDPANTLSPTEELAPGTGGPYTGGRWGDYVGVAQDPQVPNAVWQANQYATGGPNWATKVSQLQTGGATYVPINPLRVVDSRVPLGVNGIFNVSAPKTFQVAGIGPIPPDAIAVTGNVTVTSQTAGGYVSITTTATATPRSSTLNFPTGETRANNLTAPLASNGTLSAVYKAATAGKKAHVIFDVTGYFLPGSEDAAYNTVTPVRLLDTRVGNGLPGKFASGTPRELAIAGRGGIPAGAVAITANLTVVGQTRAGFVSVTPTSIPNPTTSNINFPTKDVRANGLTAKLMGGKLWLVYKAATAAQTDLILDVTGYYLAAGSGLEFFPLDPGRIMDTRSTVLTGLSGQFSVNVPRTLDTDGHWGVPAGAAAVTGNLTVTGQTAGGYVSITPTSIANPTTSTINFPLGDTRANGVTVPLNGGGTMSLVYKAGSSGRKTHLILDVTGYFD